MKCKTCEKELRYSSTGYCRKCWPKTEEAKKRNSDGLKKAYSEGRKDNQHFRDHNYGVSSKEWRQKHPEAIEKSSETIRRKFASGELKNTGVKHTEETKAYLSKKRIEFMESTDDHGIKWFEVNGHKVQGTWEKKFAEWLTEKNIEWIRNKITFKKYRRYTPDFYCPAQDCYFEVKGFLRDRDLYKMFLVLDENPGLKIKMIEKKELFNLDSIDIFTLPNFNQIYRREDIDLTKFDNVWE